MSLVTTSPARWSRGSSCTPTADVGSATVAKTASAKTSGMLNFLHMAHVYVVASCRNVCLALARLVYSARESNTHPACVCVHRLLWRFCTQTTPIHDRSTSCRLNCRTMYFSAQTHINKTQLNGEIFIKCRHTHNVGFGMWCSRRCSACCIHDCEPWRKEHRAMMRGMRLHRFPRWLF